MVMILDKSIEEILNLEWEQQEKEVIEKIIKYFNKWKYWIPKDIEDDIKFIINLAIKEKKRINELTEEIKIKNHEG